MVAIQDPQPAEANDRMCIYLEPTVAVRLRLLAVTRRRPISKVLTEHLDRTLPTAADLTAELEGAHRAAS